MKEVIHFAHGNGFPSPCYQEMLKTLGNKYTYYYVDRVGHSPDFPVTDNWEHLVHEVIESIETQADQPVIGLGHSLGGVLSALAAIKKPELFKMVILLDSPLIGRLKSKILEVSKKLGMVDLLTPAHRTKARKKHWHSKEEALAYLKTKPLFHNFAPVCLNDYIDYGMKKTKAGYSLRFDPYIEYQIYRTIPHVLYKYENQLKIPAAVIYGKKSNIIDRSTLWYMKKYYGIINFPIDGTHMFPMEKPYKAAHAIIKVIDILRRS